MKLTNGACTVENAVHSVEEDVLLVVNEKASTLIRISEHGRKVEGAEKHNVI